MTTQRLKPLSPGLKRIPLTFRRSALPSATRSLSAIPVYEVHGHVMYVLVSGTLYKVELSEDTKEKPEKPGGIETLTSIGIAWSAQLPRAGKVSLARSPRSVSDYYRPEGKTAPVMVDLATLEKFVEQKVTEALDARDSGLSKSIAAARERGASYARQEWERPENLSLSDAAKYSGRSDRVINEDRKNGRYYALVLEGNTRGFRYPRWQFDADAGRLAPVLQMLNEAGLNCWGIHQFLHSPLEPGGITAKQVILDNGAALEPALSVARQRYFSDQGAG